MKKDRSLFIKGAALIFAAALVFAGCKPEPDVPDTPDTPDTPAEVTKYTVTFDSDGGSEIAAVEVEANATVAEPETAPTKDGYTFGGWYNGEAAYDFETPVTSDLTLKASWAIKKYTVTFDLDEGTGDFPTQTVEHGAKATAPETEPTKEGFFFGGWMNGDVAYTFEEEVKADVTLKAKWSSDPVYTVTLDYGYEGAKSGSVKATKDAEYKITKPVATREGYTFDKWVDAEGKEVTFPLTVSADTTIKATWISNVTVKFMNGDTVVDTKTVTKGSAVEAPAALTKEGYKFEGWYNGETAYAAATKYDADVTYTAKWSVIEYTITYNNIISNVDNNTNPTKYTIEDDNITLVNPTSNGTREFVTWYVETETGKKTIKEIDVKKLENITISAKWNTIIASETNKVIELTYGTEVSQWGTVDVGDKCFTTDVTGIELKEGDIITFEFTLEGVSESASYVDVQSIFDNWGWDGKGTYNTADGAKLIKEFTVTAAGLEKIAESENANYPVYKFAVQHGSTDTPSTKGGETINLTINDLKVVHKIGVISGETVTSMILSPSENQGSSIGTKKDFDTMVAAADINGVSLVLNCVASKDITPYDGIGIIAAKNKSWDDKDGDIGLSSGAESIKKDEKFELVVPYKEFTEAKLLSDDTDFYCLNGWGKITFDSVVWTYVAK